MTGIDTRKIATGATLAALLGLAGLAAAAHLGRRSGERALAELRQQVEALQQLASRSDPAPLAEPAPAPPAGPRWHLADGPDVVATLQLVQGLGDAAGITFDSLTATRSGTVGRQTFRVSGRATPRGLCAFVAAIEAAERLVVVETGRILPGDEARVAFELGLATCYAEAGR